VYYLSEEYDELSTKIIEILSNKGIPLTTAQIEEEVDKLGLKCPDSAVRYLNSLRIKNIIKGKLSLEDKTWVWWI
jgi:repressor of nif and glnA expression